MTCIQQIETNKVYSLLLLANDVLQRSRDQVRIQYVAEFAKYIPPAFDLATQRNPSQVQQYERLLHIWQERQIYSNNFMTKIRTSINEISKRAPLLPPPPSSSSTVKKSQHHASSTVDYSATPSFDDEDEGDFASFSNNNNADNSSNNLLGEATENITYQRNNISSVASSSPVSPQHSFHSGGRHPSTTSSTVYSSEDSAVDNLVSGTVLNALQDSHRRFRIGLGLKPVVQQNALFTEVNSVLSKSSNILSSPSLSSIDPLLPHRFKQILSTHDTSEKVIHELDDRLIEIDNTEKLALFTLAYAQMNQRRREAVIGKLVETTVVHETRLKTIDEELEEITKLTNNLEELQNSVNDGKTVRIRKTFGTTNSNPATMGNNSSSLSSIPARRSSYPGLTSTVESATIIENSSTTGSEINRVTDYDEEENSISTFEYIIPSSTGGNEEEIVYETNDYGDINSGTNDDGNEIEEENNEDNASSSSLSGGGGLSGSLAQQQALLNSTNNYYDPTQETVTIQPRHRHLQPTSDYYNVSNTLSASKSSSSATTISVARATTTTTSTTDIAKLLGGGNRAKKRTRSSGYSGFATVDVEQEESDEDDEYILALQGSSTTRVGLTTNVDGEEDNDNNGEPKGKRPAFVFDINAAAQGKLDNTEWDPVRQIYVPLNEPDANESWRD